jgi:ABC-type sugar transport system permease subunit
MSIETPSRTVPAEETPPVLPTRRRRFQVLASSDKRWLFLMVAIPTTLHLLLVWVPALFTVALSFTKWNNLDPLTDITPVGFENYWVIFTIFDSRLFPALFNNLALMVFLFACSAVGMLLAYLLDKNIRGTAIYQSIYYFPVVLSLAVVGFIWKSVMFSREAGLLNILWPGDPIDFVGDQTKIFQFTLPFFDFPLGISRNFAALLIAMAWRHIGYVMVLYWAGLKAVDQALREAAAIDGCNEWQSFRSVIFPALKPINVVVAVITVIEALRAYDIIAALNVPRGTEVMGTLVTSSLVGEGAGRVGIGSAYGVVLLLLCLGFIIWYVYNNFREDNR